MYVLTSDDGDDIIKAVSYFDRGAEYNSNMKGKTYLS